MNDFGFCALGCRPPIFTRDIKFILGMAMRAEISLVFHSPIMIDFAHLRDVLFSVPYIARPICICKCERTTSHRSLLTYLRF